jgi:hypothetical protein
VTLAHALFRPTLLPEDERYLGASLAHVGPHRRGAPRVLGDG